jgi:hypothetical protein
MRINVEQKVRLKLMDVKEDYGVAVFMTFYDFTFNTKDGEEIQIKYCENFAAWNVPLTDFMIIQKLEKQYSPIKELLGKWFLCEFVIYLGTEMRVKLSNIELDIESYD